MNMFKKNGGFTLVELIVVIAILAILAGLAVPAYSGYISKANEAADYTQLDAIKTAVIFKVMETDAAATVTEITVTESSVTADWTSTSDADNQNDQPVDVSAYTSAMDFKSNNTKAVWSSTTAKWVLSNG